MTHYIHPLQQHPINKSTNIKPNKQRPSSNFGEVLNHVTTLKISKHAKQRMMERDITIDKETWKQINGKLHEARQKGVTDALVVVDEARLIVSTKNNTVVTALHKADTENKIFTNINGTILI